MRPDRARPRGFSRSDDSNIRNPRNPPKSAKYVPVRREENIYRNVLETDETTERVMRHFVNGHTRMMCLSSGIDLFDGYIVEMQTAPRIRHSHLRRVPPYALLRHGDAVCEAHRTIDIEGGHMHVKPYDATTVLPHPPPTFPRPQGPTAKRLRNELLSRVFDSS